ncbi:four-carbon acid sugar kinase family protein [uncultured Cloacibacillus sp.]|uniref:four-carbon acid sugar kinase family protein n=1 Tax=uncultured Cloacibacillus sp. TaxID=889794 RepID=UPI0026DC28A3|nr:four-carbon acid sugar kinase family protein [uncultured Cloacibacillus sp.]
MTKLLVIADDFTGALDTGIQFAREGTKTCVAIGAEGVLASRADYPVIVIDSETRHLPHGEAYETVCRLVNEARAAGVGYIYKKTDSALRGCVGAELSAALDAWPGADELAFVPAFPKVRRTTKGGTQYIDGVPVSESAFGRDPFEPVRHSYIPDIIAEQSEVEVRLASEAASPYGRQITVYDASTEEDLAEVAARLKTKGCTLAAGCAGLAAHLGVFIELPKGKARSPRKTKGMFVVCGSLNPISEAQILHAEAAGFKRISLTPEQKLREDYLTSENGREWLASLKEACLSDSPVIVDGFGCVEDGASSMPEERDKVEELRQRVARRLGEIMYAWFGFGLDHTLVTIGGDTLAGFMKKAGCSELTPVCELSDGVVCSTLALGGREVQIVSKSGGFGYDAVLNDIASQLLI